MSQSGNEPNTIRRRIVYHGTVQGVYFRRTAEQIATGFAVVGYVRNRPDGTVELEAQAIAAELSRFLAAVADRYEDMITRTEEQDVPPLAGERAFVVRH